MRGARRPGCVDLSSRGASDRGERGAPRRRASARRLASTTGLVALAAPLACLPTIPPDWLVDEPLILGIRPVVVRTGPNASPLTEDPPGLTRAEVLPGDTVRLIPLVADRDGPIDLEPLAPVWLRCRDGCDQNLFSARSLGEPMPQCGVGGGGLAPICRVGVGAALETRVSGYAGRYEDYLMIVGTPGGRSSEACVDALLGSVAGVDGEVFDCLYVQRRIDLGPYKKWLALEEEPPYDPASYEDFAPNYNPEIERLTLWISGRGGTREVEAHDGDVVSIAVGERVDVRVVTTEATIQEYFAGGPPYYPTRTEKLNVSWFLSASLDEVDADEDALLHSFRVPAGISSFDEYAILRDGRASLSTARIRWQVVDE